MCIVYFEESVYLHVQEVGLWTLYSYRKLVCGCFTVLGTDRLHEMQINRERFSLDP